MKPQEPRPPLPKGLQWALLGGVALICLLLNFPLGQQSTSAMTAEEQRIASALSLIEGAGDTRVVICASEDGSAAPTGAVIVCQGARDLTVQLRLRLALQTLLSLSADSIRIFPMEASP